MNKYADQAKESRRRFKQWRACGRKRRYASRQAALVNDPAVKVYRCPYCKGFHRSHALQTIIGVDRKWEAA